MYPPPTTTSRSGTASRASASVEEITAPKDVSPNGRWGNSIGADPVASTTCSAATVSVSPSLVVTRAVLPSISSARPAMTRAPARVNNPDTPSFKRPTMSFFQAIVAARSTDTPATEIPISGFSVLALAAAYSSAA